VLDQWLWELDLEQGEDNRLVTADGERNKILYLSVLSHNGPYFHLQYPPAASSVLFSSIVTSGSAGLSSGQERAEDLALSL